MLHVDAAALADPSQPGQSALEEVGHVPAETSRRLACDASRVVMRHDEQGRLLEIGARTRTIPPALRRALQNRDRSCRFPGCQVRVGQGHHVRHWAQGGPTILSNLVLLCRRHHRAVHEDGYRIVRATDGTLGFLRPDGLAGERLDVGWARGCRGGEPTAVSAQNQRRHGDPASARSAKPRDHLPAVA
ncbi:MAG TPA: HNH endonuclease signature motif containing protein, partial [Methylomirabilota bacterium]